jgi:hypothetical protein
MFRCLTTCLLTIGVPAAASAEAPPVIYEASIPGYTIPHARDVVVDATGAAYLIGSAYDDGVHLDVLVAKFDPAGSLLWTRYITSSDHNYATGLALDAANDVWVTGWTDSPDFPVVNPLDDTLTGFRDVFLMKLDTDDGAILYSTFLGGDYTDSAEGIALNAAGEIYLTGTTGSTDFPVTADAYQPEPNFPLYFFTDAFVTKLSPTGDEILYSTYFGGLEDDQGRRIALDTAANIVIAGTTEAGDFPLVNALQAVPDDLFISKLSADGSTLLFSTYFGGEDWDRIGGMTLDDSDRLYLVGSTRSVAFPTTPGAYQENFVGAINGCEVPFGEDYNCEDLYVTKLATDGGGIVWSTYLGGTAVEEGRDIAVDGLGCVYVTGYTGSADFPPDGMDFGAEIIVCRLDATGSSLDYTYSVDSGSANRGNGIALDGHGDVYFTGTLGVPASIYLSKLGGRMATGVEVGSARDLTALSLGPGYPNPFRPTTRFDYVIPNAAAASAVSLRVYDVAGHLVRELVDTPQASGSYSVTWRGTDDRGAAVTSGVYFVRLQAGSEVRTQKVVKLRE